MVFIYIGAYVGVMIPGQLYWAFTWPCLHGYMGMKQGLAWPWIWLDTYIYKICSGYLAINHMS